MIVEINLKGLFKWIVVGKDVYVDPRYIGEYRATLRRKVGPISRAVAVCALTYVSMFIGVLAQVYYAWAL